jgi:hypothetical protein
MTEFTPTAEQTLKLNVYLNGLVGGSAVTQKEFSGLLEVRMCVGHCAKGFVIVA